MRNTSGALSSSSNPSSFLSSGNCILMETPTPLCVTPLPAAGTLQCLGAEPQAQAVPWLFLPALPSSGCGHPHLPMPSLQHGYETRWEQRPSGMQNSIHSRARMEHRVCVLNGDDHSAVHLQGVHCRHWEVLSAGQHHGLPLPAPPAAIQPRAVPSQGL